MDMQTLGTLRLGERSGNMLAPHKGDDDEFKKMTDHVKRALRDEYGALDEDRLRWWCNRTAAEFGMSYGIFVSAVGILD